jgi:hypothetical protein
MEERGSAPARVVEKHPSFPAPIILVTKFAPVGVVEKH